MTPAPRASWVESIIEWSARNPFLVVTLVAALSLLGWHRMRQTPLDAIPDLSDPQVIVLTAWEGRSPDLVEDQITAPLVSRLMSVPRVKVVRGISFFGYSYVYVIFGEGTDLYWARSRVSEHLQSAQNQMPAESTATLGPDATGVGWGFQYALVDRTGKHDAADLRSFQDWTLRPWLQSVEGVAEIATFGGYEKQYQVEIDDTRLVNHGLTFAEIAAAIRAANGDAGGGEVERFGTTHLVRGRGYLRSTEDLGLVPVGRSGDGTPVLLSTVARSIAIGPAMRRGSGDLDGLGETPGGIVVVRAGENVLRVIDRVKQKLADVTPSLPAGVEVVTTYDRSDLIHRAIGTLSRTLVEEAIIVSLVVILFLLDFGGAVRAVVTLPLAVLLAFIPMQALGLTTNLMSLGGIAIAMGAMVDEAIVMVENVHKRLEHAPPGLDRARRKEIIISACRQLGKPLFFALLIITVSFLPVFALEAEEGRLFKPLAYTKTFAMAAAALLSITLGPALVVGLTGARVIPERRHPVSRFLQRVYYPWVSALMRRRALSIGLAVLAVASCVPVATRLGSEFMPPLNEGDILYMPSSWPTISIGEASRLMQIQDRLLKAYPEVASVHGKAGRAETATDPAPMEMFETVVRLKPVSEWRTVSRPRWYSPWAPEGLARVLRPLWSDRRPLRMEELVAALDEDVRIPGAPNVWTRPIQNRIDMNATGIRTAVGVKIFGSDAVAIERVAEEVERVLRDVPGTRSVVVERPARGMYLDIEPDRAALARLGLNLDALWETVETAIGGMPVTEVIQGRERFTVNLRLPREHRDSVEALRRVLIPVPARPAADAMAGGPAAARVALSQVARVTLRPGPAMVRNEDGGRTGWIYVDIADRDLGGYVEAARRAVRERVENAGLLPAGMHIAWAGQYEFLLRVRERLKVVVPLTLALIFLLLQLNFKSLPATLLVLVSVPFALTGSVWILFWLDYHVSVAVWIGIIALAGLAAQTGIVMLVYLEEAHRLYQRAGRLRTQHDLFECITYGAVQRVRPKVMTVTTTLLGLAPLLWSEGTGADVMKRIAAPMAGGLISSFFLTLELIPALYSLWRGRGVQWVPGRPPRKSWDELSGIFHQLEAEEALRYLSPDARGATPSPPSAGAPTRTQEIP